MGWFNGRINRRTYAFGLFIDLMLFGAAVLYVFFLSSAVTLIIEVLLIISGIVFLFSIITRRRHDIGDRYSENNILRAANGLNSFNFPQTYFQAGEKKVNKYGKPPRP